MYHKKVLTTYDTNFHSYLHLVKAARYELRRCVRARTRAMCGRICACACEIHSEKCAECACVRLVFGLAMCDCIFSHFWNQIAMKLSENLF